MSQSRKTSRVQYFSRIFAPINAAERGKSSNAKEMIGRSLRIRAILANGELRKTWAITHGL
jgi:hypothetical protein